MQAQALDDRRASSTRTRRRCPRTRCAQGSELLQLAGRRPLHLPRLPRVPPRAARATTSCAARRPGHRPRHPARRPGHVRRRSASCPPPVRGARPARRPLLVLAKANSRATVHRPAYLDYVGVKTFDEHGEVVGERRFLGLFSSAAYTESRDPDPGAAREGRRGARAARRSTPRSHAGKALMDILETYPRDELFHTPSTSWSRSPRRCMHARERRQLRLFVRRDTYGRYVSAWSTCRATATTPRSASGSRDDPASDELRRRARRVHRPGQRVATWPGCTSSSARPRATIIARRRRRRPRAAARRGGPLVARRLHRRGHRRVRRGGRRPAGPALRRRVPRGLQGGLPGPHRLGRPRPPGGASPATHGIDLSLYEQIDAGRGEARLKVFRIGSPLSLSRGAADAVVDGRRGRRRAALRARRACARPSLHLRVRAALRPRRCPPQRARRCSRTRCARSGTATTRSTASTRWCSRPG